MKIAVAGLGLIGGSIALTLRNNGFGESFIGIEENPEHAKRALELGLVDEICPFEEGVKKSELIIIAVPVDATVGLVMKSLDLIDNQVIMDVGSTKGTVVKAIKNHPKRKRFVATHPIWGTEFSGPDAARNGEMKGRLTVICNPESSDKDAVDKVEALYKSLEMHTVYQDADSHDLHAAYVSHISHLTSFALALAVLDKEKEEEQIFRLAGAGFQSTVRLAKSNPDTWVPIFKDNRSNVLDVLNDQIFFLRQMKKLIEMEEYDTLHKLLSDANAIKKIIK